MSKEYVILCPTTKIAKWMFMYLCDILERKGFPLYVNKTNLTVRYMSDPIVRIRCISEAGYHIAMRGFRGQVVNVYQAESTLDKIKKDLDTENPRWVIHTKHYHGHVYVGYSVHPYAYKHKRSAVRRAKQLWGSNPNAKWTVVKVGAGYI